ncbi:hypothetical protein ACFQ1E_08090 [Sphingomonas canadensis]|uniref:Uncharacterized protein n=1 Tax=Sphingomonas canadensis TaxID=1219257 RepID=A0ABW3H601_9SPHN|nr:hypothetical protein [Sphingomonas canadensis]MCW3835996.1 hypothetical protein [Sphingomonas canadensis]
MPRALRAFAPSRENLKQGYAPLYRAGMACPGCGAGHWIVGRASAECASCHTAIPLAPAQAAPAAIGYPAWSRRP